MAPATGRDTTRRCASPSAVPGNPHSPGYPRSSRWPALASPESMKPVGAGHIYRGRADADRGGPGAAQEGGAHGGRRKRPPDPRRMVGPARRRRSGPAASRLTCARIPVQACGPSLPPPWQARSSSSCVAGARSCWLRWATASDAGAGATGCAWPVPSWPWCAACSSSATTPASTGPSPCHSSAAADHHLAGDGGVPGRLVRRRDRRGGGWPCSRAAGRWRATSR